MKNNLNQIKRIYVQFTQFYGTSKKFRVLKRNIINGSQLNLDRALH